MSGRILGVVAVVVSLAACGGGNPGTTRPIEPPDGGPEDDAGTPDGGDAGFPLPTSEGWTFYGAAQGGPAKVFGVTADRGGNLWVAGGEEGLFLLRPGAQRFERFTLDDGLRPYGYTWPSQGTITQTYLNVASVSGGPAGTVFVGYLGMPAPEGAYGCEDNWDGPNPDPNIYKSGDADKVTLTGSGIRVVHYDISSGENVVAGEPRGREKICDVYRILYDESSQSVWFGGNHAFAWGDPNYAGNPTCYSQPGCSGVMEHAHPLLNAYPTEDADALFALTNYYWGLAVGAAGDVWVGGMFRSLHCGPGFRGAAFWDCESAGLDPAKQIDWWPDLLQTDSRPSQRTDDKVSSMALGPDGSLWVGSFENGLARRAPDGSVGFITSGLVDPTHVTALAVDPSDGSVWVGANYGGLTRIKGGQFIPYDYRVFGGAKSPLVNDRVTDIQVDSSGGGRKILVGFRAGAIGVYEDP